MTEIYQWLVSPEKASKTQFIGEKFLNLIFMVEVMNVWRIWYQKMLFSEGKNDTLDNS